MDTSHHRGLIMREGRARRLALGVLALVSLWSFVPVAVDVERVLPVRYAAIGLSFHVDRHHVVKAISVEGRRRIRSTKEPPDKPARPGTTEIVPGVGACRVMLDDTQEAVVAAVGAPTRDRRTALHTHRFAHLIYEDLFITLKDDRVTSIVTSREDARTPEGIGVGSSRQQVAQAYGRREREMLGRAKEGEEMAGTVVSQAPLTTSVTGAAWHSRAAGAIFYDLITSLVGCLTLSLAPRRRAWAGILLACAGTWVGVCVGIAVWGIVSLMVPQMWSWIRYGSSLFVLEKWVFLKDMVRFLVASVRWSSRDVVIVAGLVGLFVAGRVAVRRLHLSGGRVYLLCCLGAVVFGTGARVLVNALQPHILTVLYQHRGNLLTNAAVPCLALSVCFLVVASQRTRWWENVRSALGMPPLQEKDAG